MFPWYHGSTKFKELPEDDRLAIQQIYGSREKVRANSFTIRLQRSYNNFWGYNRYGEIIHSRPLQQQLQLQHRRQHCVHTIPIKIQLIEIVNGRNICNAKGKRKGNVYTGNAKERGNDKNGNDENGSREKKSGAIDKKPEKKLSKNEIIGEKMVFGRIIHRQQLFQHQENRDITTISIQNRTKMAIIRKNRNQTHATQATIL